MYGWPIGPDGVPLSQDFMDFNVPLGNLSILDQFIAANAPHCRRLRVQDLRAYSKATIEFQHEPQYLTELFQLDGLTSPQHGIIRPLRLRYRRREPPAVQGCSLCGKAGHSGKRCPLLSQQAGPSSAQPLRACRDCYSTDPQHVCQTEPEQRLCKLCGEHGHTPPSRARDTARTGRRCTSRRCPSR